jgi:hypothetical protein
LQRYRIRAVDYGFVSHRRIEMTRKAWPLLTGLLVFVVTPAFASTLTVTNTLDGGPGSLRSAIALAAAGDTIEIAVTGTITLAAGPLTIQKNLLIAGPGPELIAISGNSAMRVLTVSSASTVTISGVTIRNGRADNGGGIFNGGRLTLTNAVIAENVATYYGGGLYSESGSTLTVINSVVSGNSASVGGGVMNHDGAVSLSTTTLAGNLAAGCCGGSGGGLYNGGLGGTVHIADSTITDNVASAQGGAVHMASGTMTLLNSTVANNTCSCDSGGCSGGGGIYSHSSAVTVAHSTLANNVSRQGGSITSLYGTTTIKHSLLAKGSSGSNCYYYDDTGIVSDGYNLSDDASCSPVLTAVGDLNDVPAGLSPAGLRDNGGTTHTIALLASSRAVDAVLLHACADPTGQYPADQRGVERPQADACDIGALELGLHAADLTLAAPVPSSLVAGAAGPVELSARMTRHDTGLPIAGATIGFVVKGTSVGWASTDASGWATLAYDPSFLAPGMYQILATSARQTIADVAFEASASNFGALQIESSPYTARIQSPIDSDGTSVFRRNRGVIPVKFTLSYSGTPTCQLPQATIALVRTSGAAIGPVSETVYALPADDGANFRIDTNSCTYVYNLGSSLLGNGTYIVRIRVNGSFVGDATFGLE